MAGGSQPTPGLVLCDRDNRYIAESHPGVLVWSCRNCQRWGEVWGQGTGGSRYLRPAQSGRPWSLGTVAIAEQLGDDPMTGYK